MNKDNGLTGTSAECFVAAELLRRKWHVALTMKNAEGIDVLCSDGKKNIAIQVKSTENLSKHKTWVLGKKNEEWIGKDKFYVFVDLNYLQMPNYYIFPSEVIAGSIKNYHKWWVSKGRKDTSMRIFPATHKEYMEEQKMDIQLKDYTDWNILWK